MKKIPLLLAKVIPSILFIDLSLNRYKKIKGSVPERDEKTQKVLILSSGGYIGVAWHIAKITKLSDENLLDINDYDLVVGTSAGAIAALAIQSNLSGRELIEKILLDAKADPKELFDLKEGKFFKKVNLKELLNQFSGRKFATISMLANSIINEGRSSLNVVEETINELLGSKWPKNTLLVAGDVNTGDRVILNHKSGLSPGRAAIASASVPGIFKPIIHHNKKLIDGGLISSTHFDIALLKSASEITLLTTSKGFINPLKARNHFEIISIMKENYENLKLQKYLTLCKLRKIKVKIIKPSKIEQEIIDKSNLVENKDIELLVSETLK